MKIIWFSYLFIPLSFLLLAQCGYHIQKQDTLPFTEIHIGIIQNKSLEPKLQDMLHQALTEEFQKQGIGITPSAGKKLEGTILNFEMFTLSEKEGIAVEYQVIIKAHFTLTDEIGVTREIRNISSPFIVSFVAADDFALLLAGKETAEKKAMEDFAMRIVGALIYQ